MRGLVAEKQSEVLWRLNVSALWFHAAVGQALGALAEPEVLRHFLDQHVLGASERLVLFVETVQQCIVLLLIFRGEDGKESHQAMVKIVPAGSGFACFGFGTGG
jgi:uncharacterized membrane protein YsdA (DUF1294 family)